MGADLDICVEYKVAPGGYRRSDIWFCASMSRMVYRGRHSDLLRDAGAPMSKSTTRDGENVSWDTDDFLEHEEPYWIRTMSAANFIAFASDNFHKEVAGMPADYPEDKSLFDPGNVLPSLVAFVRDLASRHAAVRVVYWYGQ